MKEFSGYTDCEGKNICEGDIVVKTTSLDKSEWKYVVKMDENECFTIANHFEKDGDLSMYCNGMWGGPLEIKGNIYDNPELIQEEIEYIKLYRETLRIGKLARENGKA